MLRQYFLELYRKNKMIMYKMYNMYTILNHKIKRF